MQICKSPSPASVERNSAHLYWLDWLRFLAALMVVAAHARGGNWLEWGRLAEASQTKLVAIFFALTRAGTESVLVFFVLSGFLVGGKMIERLMDGTFDLRTYILDRVSRIYTPLAPALCWSALVAFWLGKRLTWFDLGTNLLGLQGGSPFPNFGDNMPLWSLGYEIWFYILAGSAAVWLKAGTRGRIAATLALAAGFAVFTMMKATFLFAWILGAATFWMCSRPRQPWLAAVGGVLVVIGYISNQLRSATTSVNTSGWMHYAPSNDIAILLLSLGIAVLLPFFTQLEPKSMLGVRMNHLGAKLAAFSYTLYLTHYPMLYVWEHFLPERHASIDVTSLIWYLLRIFSCLAFAWLCYLPFEKQTGRLRKKLQKIWTQPSKVAA